MGLSNMKDELHGRLFGAMERWFDLKEQGWTKHGLKMEGIREHSNMFYATRGLIFTGATRLAYERELKHFINFAQQDCGKTTNAQVDKKDFRAYMEARMARGGAASELNKVRAAIVKFGALYGKYESFHAMSKKVGVEIREMRAAGTLRGPARPHVTPQVRQAVVERLARLDTAWEQRAKMPRGYSLVTRLQQEAGLRAIEATDRFTRGSLVGLEGDKGQISIVGKGGKVRPATISRDLYTRLDDHFKRSQVRSLASRRSYQVALRRATLAVGGQATASHAHRRTWAVEMKNAKYKEYLKEGKSPKEARRLAVQDTVELLGHSRNRKDLAAAYLSA